MRLERAGVELLLAGALGRLRLVLPSGARRAAQALDVTLAGVRSSLWPDVAWRASSLTNTGFPVELSWSSRDQAVRWTAEPTGPEVPELERLRAAQAILRRLGVEAEAPEWLARRPVEGKGHQFGAWLGGRHDDSGDRYKLYVELAGMRPPDALLGAAGGALPARTTWRMAGVNAGEDSVELYARLHRPELWEIARLLSVAGIFAEPLVSLTAELTGRGQREQLLPGTAGLSLVASQGRLVAAACFVHAGPLLGDDGAVRRVIDRVAERHGWDTSVYDAILGPSRAARTGPGRHGMIGVGVGRDGAAWLQVGMRP